MINSLTLLASESGIHVSLKAEKILQIGSISITNAIIYGAISTVLIALMVLLIARKVSYRPQHSKAAGIFELVAEFVISLLQGPFVTRAKAAKYAPVFGTFFIFIMFNNIMGLLPLVGSQLAVGESPLLRPFTADLNGTIAMAVIAIVYIQILSIKEQGVRGHLKHYFTDRPWNPINFFIGILEVFGELTRITSLSLRLFLNTAVGEILIAVFASVVISGGKTPLAVIPILLFEVLVAGIQAYVFTILTATYLGLAVQHADHGDAHDVHHAPAVPKTKVEAVRS